MSQVNHRSTREKRTLAVRKKLFGTSDRPRLTVFRSNQHIYLQAIDDERGQTVATASDVALDKGSKKKLKGTKTEKAVEAAKQMAKNLKKAKIKQIVFDRGPYRYHGRVKAVAETLRKADIKF